MKQVSDADVWRTIHAAKVKLDESTGEIKMGMGGKYTGRKINRLSKKAREEDDRADADAKEEVERQIKYEKAGVPKWYLNQKLSQGEAYAASTSGDWSVRRESDKAVLMRADTDYGHVDVWVPKSIMNRHLEEQGLQSPSPAKNRLANPTDPKSVGVYAAKLNSGVELPHWYKLHNLTLWQQQILERAPQKEFTQEKETEKAVLIKVTGINPANNYSESFQMWVPKTVIEKMEKLKNEPYKPPPAEVTAKVNKRIEAAYKWAEERGYTISAREWSSYDQEKDRTYITIYGPRRNKGGVYKSQQWSGGYIDNKTGEYFPDAHTRAAASLPEDSKEEINKIMQGNVVLDAKPSARTIDDNGFMHVSITPISKACVNPYLGREIPGWEELGLKPEQIYYGLRDAGELAKAANTFNGLPVLMDHHQTDAKNPAKEYTVGSTGTDAKFEAPYLKNSLSITDVDAILAIQDGSARELSCAYRFTPDFTGGEYDAGDGNKISYDFVMRDIVGNHVALVAEGRAGHDVAVADAMPQIKIQKRSDQRMNRRQKMMAFKRRRNGLAQDANLGIEAAEVLSAGFQKALNAIEAQVEGYAPREVGLDIDEGATVDEIIAKFMPGLDDETKATYKGVLLKLKGDTAVDAGEELPAADDDPENPMGAGDNDPDFAEGVKYGEELEKNPQERLKLDKEHEREGEEKAEDDDLDERMKDPAFREAFEMGVKYGEKREKADPKKIDRDHEREGMERVLGQDSIAKIKKQVAKDMRNSLRSLNTAAAKVRPLVGTITDPMAFDSADEIFAFALRQSGQNPENYPKAAYAGMVDMLLAGKPSYGMAADSAFSRRNSLDEQAEKAFARLKDIQ